MNNRPTGSGTRFARKGYQQALALMLTRTGSSAPEYWKPSNRRLLKECFDLKINLQTALAMAGINRTGIHPDILDFLNGKRTFINVFGKTPFKTPKKPGTQKKKVKFENGGNGNGNTRNNPIIINAIKKLENKLAKQEEAIVRARESQTQQALENSRRQLTQIRKEIREQQRNLREVVMRRGGSSYRPGGLRATPYYTRFMERVYERDDGQFVTLSPNGRPRRPMAYPNFTYRDTGRGIVLHAPMYTRRPRRKTLFRL
jgi:hypothetical protein